MIVDDRKTGGRIFEKDENGDWKLAGTFANELDGQRGGAFVEAISSRETWDNIGWGIIFNYTIGRVFRGFRGGGRSKSPSRPAANTSSGRMFGSQGAQFTSKTVWNKGQYRIDVENPNPGQRAGQIHFQDQASGAKYLYDPTRKEFVGAPNSVNRMLDDPEIQTAINKAMRFLGENE